MKRSLPLLALSLNFALSGCILIAASPGDVTFTWTFQSLTCSQAGVNNVRIRIPGQILVNDGVFPCEANGVQGIILHDFSGGSYTYTIDGRDFSNVTLYTKSGSFFIDGSKGVNVDLLPPGGNTAYAYITWTFPQVGSFNNPTCAQASINTVNVRIDSGAWLQPACSEGQTSSGYRVGNLSSGSHNIEFSAVDSTGYEYFSGTSTLNASSGGTSNAYALNWAVGGVTMHWTLADNGAGMTCGSFGVTEVYVNFREEYTVGMPLLFSGSGDRQSCTAAGPFYYLKPGTYGVFVQATDSMGGLHFSTDRTSMGLPTTPPLLTITAGNFPELTYQSNRY